MKKKIKKGKDKDKKITAASVIVNLLSQKVVPADDALINAVLAKVEGSNFNKAQLSWYKNKFRQGKFHGGKPQVINQPSMKKEKVKNAGKKKIKIKRK